MIDGAASDIASWSALAVAGIGGIITATFWLRIGSRLGRADSAMRIAETAIAKADLVSAQLTDAKIDFAEKLGGYVTDKDLAAAEGRIANSLDGLRGDVRGMNDRLDRIFEHPNTR